MSISERNTRAVVIYYVSNTATLEYSITFPFLNDPKNLAVYHRDQDGVLSKLVYPTEYVVMANEDGSNNIWGKVSLNAGYELAVGDTIAIERRIPVSQETTFSNQKVFSSVMDYAIDKITAILQDRQFENNTLHAPIDENSTANTLNIGTATERANKFLGFDSLGKVTLVTSAGGDGTDRCLRIPLDESPVPDLVMYKELRAGNLPYFDDAGNLQWMYAKSLIGIEVTIADAVRTAKAAETTANTASETADGASSTANAAKETSEEAIATAKVAKTTADQALEDANLYGGAGININKTLIEKLSDLPATGYTTFNNKFYNISSDRNTIYVGTDGITWQSYSNSGVGDINSFGFVNDYLIAGKPNAGRVYYRKLDTSWSEKDVGANGSEYCKHTACTNGVGLWIGDEGSLCRTTDGLTWTKVFSYERQSYPTYRLNFCGDRWIAVSDSGTETYLVSLDNGATWTQKEFSGNWKFAFSGKGSMILVTGDSIIRYSDDGFETYQEATITPAVGNIIFGAYDQNKYVFFTESGQIVTSEDLTKFSVYLGYQAFNLGGVSYNAATGTFVIAGGNSITCQIYDSKRTVLKVTASEIPASENQFGTIKPKFGLSTSTGLLSADCGQEVFINEQGNIDTVNRQLIAGANITITKNKYINSNNLNTSKTYKYICGHDGSWVAWNSTDNKIIHSTDGVTWLEVYTPAANLRGIKYLNGAFVAYGESTGLYTSSDGESWAQTTTTGILSNTIFDIAYGVGVYVIVHQPSRTALATTSSLTDLSGLTSFTTDADDYFRLKYDGYEFIYCGHYAGKIYRSTDGLTWDGNAAMTANYPYWVLRLRNNEYLLGAEWDIDKSYDDLKTVSKLTLPTWFTAYKTSAAFGRGVIVAGVNNENEYNSAYSTDLGETWNKIPFATWEVEFHNGRFIAGHNTNLYVSDNGIDWNTLTLPGNLENYYYADNKLFVAGSGYVGHYCDEISASGGGESTPSEIIEPDNYTYLPNPKALNTVTITGVSGSYWRKAAYGNSKIVINSTTNNIVYSSDGLTWLSTLMPGASADWYSTVYGNGKFISVVASSNRGAYSTDGVTWTEFTLPITVSAIPVLAYGNGKFVLLSDQTALYSADGITWQSATLPVTGTWELCYGDKFVALKYGSSVGIYSTDGITWTQITLPLSKTWSGIAYGNGLYIATTDEGDAVIIYSTDGITWAEGAKTSGRFPRIAYGNGVWCMISAVSQTTNLIYSFDGSTWYTPATTLDNTSAIFFAKGRFYIVPYNTNTLRYSNRVSIYPTLAQSIVGS